MSGFLPLGTTRAELMELARAARLVTDVPAEERRGRGRPAVVGGGGLRTETAALALWEQACRQKWRALALLVKAKLEAVDAGISTVEQAFYADIVMSDNRTVYERTREAVALEYSGGAPVALLGGSQ